ncbi:nuclear transport factor 2 family protein [Emticicia sp. SJ17W-69]|uniref:nuclear transport factor 2 family protein n=1 Tax=Emticicia sp. SJ17W-69 TaxID=3421657 RepID=UPI003EBB77D6
MKTLITLFAFLPSLIFAQATLTKAQLEEYDKKLKENPVETVKQYTHKDFTFISGNGSRVGYNELLANYTYNKETVRNLTDVKITQVNQTASVTGKIEHEWFAISNPAKVSKYKGMFTYIYVYDAGAWKIISAQHTDFANKEQEVAAIKKVIEGETQAYLDGDGKKLLSYWADKKTNEHASQYLVQFLGQPYATGESMAKLQNLVVPNLKKQDFKIERDDIDIRINKDMAWATYTQKVNANGKILQTDRETRILERINGDWKLVYVGEQAMK